GVIGAVWLRGAVARHRARRRAEATQAALIAGTASRLRTAIGDHELAVALDVLTGGPLGPPRSVGAIAREVAAAMRSTGVPVTLAVTPGRIEIRDEGSAAVTGFDGELARGLARRAGGEVHLFEGLAVLELPA